MPINLIPRGFLDGDNFIRRLWNQRLNLENLLLSIGDNLESPARPQEWPPRTAKKSTPLSFARL